MDEILSAARCFEILEDRRHGSEYRRQNKRFFLFLLTRVPYWFAEYNSAVGYGIAEVSNSFPSAKKVLEDAIATSTSSAKQCLECHRSPPPTPSSAGNTVGDPSPDF